MKKSSIGLFWILLSMAFWTLADDMVSHCWERERAHGGTCTIKLYVHITGGLYASTAGTLFATQGSQVCTGEDPGDSHVFGNVFLKDDHFEAGLTSVGMALDKSLVWHSGGVFEVDGETFDAVLYWNGDTEEKCGEATVPCVVEEQYSYADCFGDL